MTNASASSANSRNSNHTYVSDDNRRLVCLTLASLLNDRFPRQVPARFSRKPRKSTSRSNGASIYVKGVCDIVLRDSKPARVDFKPCLPKAWMSIAKRLQPHREFRCLEEEVQTPNHPRKPNSVRPWQLVYRAVKATPAIEDSSEGCGNFSTDSCDEGGDPFDWRIMACEQMFSCEQPRSHAMHSFAASSAIPSDADLSSSSGSVVSSSSSSEKDTSESNGGVIDFEGASERYSNDMLRADDMLRQIIETPATQSPRKRRKIEIAPGSAFDLGLDDEAQH